MSAPSKVGKVTIHPTTASLQKLNRVLLTGFMGAGKTSVGRKLAEALCWQFVDLDEEIERRQERSVSSIFEESGEAEFRRTEYKVLASALRRKQTVLALGGGAPETLGNRLLMEQTPGTAVVHLAAPFTILVERCQAQESGSIRPLLSNLGTAKDRYEQRQRIYARVATHSIETSQLDQDEIVEEVLAALSWLKTDC